jgi:non-ribosomal peptide synthetase component F
MTRIVFQAHHLIEARTHKQPDSLAVYSLDGNLTYAELDELSSRLACYLASQGIGPEDFVPLCFEKSKWTIVALLAVLKAGGAFVLLDPSQPTARMKSTIQQTNAKLALSSAEHIGTCKHIVDVVFIVNATNVCELKSASIPRPVNPQNAAYVIFTSGSTGEPKGVVIEHLQLSTSSTKSGEAMGFPKKNLVFFNLYHTPLMLASLRSLLPSCLVDQYAFHLGGSAKMASSMP